MGSEVYSVTLIIHVRSLERLPGGDIGDACEILGESDPLFEWIPITTVSQATILTLGSSMANSHVVRLASIDSPT